MHTERIQSFKSKLDDLLAADAVPYLNLTESKLPNEGGYI